MAALQYSKPVTKQQLNKARALIASQTGQKSTKSMMPRTSFMSTWWKQGTQPYRYVWNSIFAPNKNIGESYRNASQATETGYYPSNIPQKEAIKHYLDFTNQHSKYLIPKQFFNQRGGLVPGAGKTAKERWLKYREDAQKRGKSVPTFEKFVSLNTPQAVRAVTQESQQSPVAGAGAAISDVGTNIIGGNQGLYVAGLFSPKIRQKAQQQLETAKVLREYGQKRFNQLSPAQKVQYMTTGPAVAMFGPKATSIGLKYLLLPQLKYLPLTYATGKFGEALTQDKQAVGNALINGDTSQLTEQQKALYNDYVQKKHLPAYKNDNAIQGLYGDAGKQLLNQVSTWRNVSRNAGYFLAPASGSLRSAGRQFLKKQPVKALKKLYPTGKMFTDVAYMSPDLAIRNPQAISTQHQFIKGQLPQEQIQQAKVDLQQQKIPVTAQNVIAQVKANRTTDAVTSSWAPSLYNIPGVKSWMKSKTESGIQNSMKQLQQFGSLSPQEQQKALPKLLQQMRGFYKDSTSQAAALAYLDDPDNQQALTGMFDKMSTQQLSSLVNGYTALSEKGPRTLPTSVTLIGNALQNAAQKSAATRFQKGLSQRDPQKFEAHMKEWLPLFSKFKAQDGKYDALKDKAHKAVWGHVKKNPLFINKAMSFWAMQNGYNNLASFLGSNGAFYGTLVGLPLTIALISSLFGGNKQAPQQIPQPQYYQPMAYAPRGITERGLIVG